MANFFEVQGRILSEIEALSGADRLDYLAALARADMTTAPEGAARWQIIHVVNGAISAALASHTVRLCSTLNNLAEVGDYG